MKKNVGIYDTIFRLIFAIVVALLIFLGILKGLWAIILGIAGGVLLITGLVGWCGLYAALGIRTCPMKEKPNN